VLPQWRGSKRNSVLFSFHTNSLTMLFMPRSLLALLSLFGLGVSAHAESRWIHLRTDDLEMYSTAGEAAARETVRNFEQVRSFFAQSARSGRSDQSAS
jgi:hypothetical protein